MANHLGVNDIRQALIERMKHLIENARAVRDAAQRVADSTARMRNLARDSRVETVIMKVRIRGRLEAKHNPRERNREEIECKDTLETTDLGHERYEEARDQDTARQQADRKWRRATFLLAGFIMQSSLNACL